MTDPLANISPAEQAAFLELMQAYITARQENQLTHRFKDTYDNGHQGTVQDPAGPYDYQVEFIEAGADNPERAAIWANQIGKSDVCAGEVACHVTGWYPEWWKGHKFTAPTVGCVAGPTNEKTRDVCQKALLGEMKEGERQPTGFGWIPAKAIIDVSYRQCGITNVAETALIRHVSGGVSKILFKSFEQGATKFQGDQWDWGWFDEEPPDPEIFTEGLTRLLVKNGRMLFSRTPLFGNTAIIKHFMDGGPGIWYSMVGWDRCPHMTDALQARMLESYPEHERDTRMKGVPILGSGGVYTVPDEVIQCDPFEIPDHWARICGIDFGIDHPFAAVWEAWDRDADVVYVYDSYKIKGETPSYHAAAIKSRGAKIPVAWPHDGLNREKGSGQNLRDQFIALGVNMLPLSARLSDERGGGQDREAATMLILDRMRTGRFKVFSHLHGWFEEKRMLHRDNGRIVDKNDDEESATRYATMMLRYAQSVTEFAANPVRFADQAPGDAPYDPFACLERRGA